MNLHQRKAPSARRRIAAAAVEALEARQLLSAGDTNFEPLGIALKGFQFDYHNGVTTQQDGKILVAGYVGTTGVGTGTDVAVARFNANGTVDGTYGSGGIATIALAGDQEAKAIALDYSGRAVVAGTTRSGGPFSFAVARFNTGGSPDNTFDGDGLATASFTAGQNALAYSVVVQSDNKIVAAGKAYDGAKYDFALARFDAAGTLDSSFDGDGLRTHTPVVGATSSEITGLALQGDGKLVAVGTSNTLNDQGKFLITRYTAAGANDNPFGTSGVVIANFGVGNVAGAIGVALQADGKIVAAGGVTATPSGVTHFALARYTSAGAADNSFDGDGKATVAFGNNDRGEAVAMQTIGGTQKIVVAGSTGSNGDVAIARLNLNGSLDTSFDGDGKVQTAVSFPGNTGVERVPGLAIETLTGPFASNIITVGVDTSNNLILTSHDANSATTGATPNKVWAGDEWTTAYDAAPVGLSNGDILYDASSGTTTTYGIDGFTTIPSALGGVSSSGTVAVLGGSDKIFATGTFSIGANQVVDLSDNSLIVHGGNVGTWTGSAYTGLTGLIASGRGNDGAWAGKGIVTSQSSAIAPNTLTSLAIASGNDLFGIAGAQTALFMGQTVTGSDVLIKYTYEGDANLDGVVTGDDYFQIDSAVPQGLRGWFNGDFNYDGTVTGDDYFLIDSTFPAQGQPFPSADLVADLFA